MKEILIRSARLAGAEDDAPLHDLLVRAGKIAAVAVTGSIAADVAGEVIEAGGLMIAPGLIDVHVHLREPGQTHKETIATGTRAAARGGFTTVVAMPNTLPVNDSVATMEWMLDRAREPTVRLLAMPAATVGSLGERLTDYAALARAGAVGFTDDGRPVLDDAVMRAALVAAARVGLPVSQHAEDTRMTVGCSMNHGAVAFRLGLRGMTIEAEAAIVERDLGLLREIEATEKLRPHLHVQHVSTARALDAIRMAKQQGLHVTCEVAPHHFALTEAAIAGEREEYAPRGVAYNTNAKMNPPLRAEHDRLAVLEALLDGTVDCIATDHAPHASHEKEVEFERAPNGITGLETALGLTLRILHRQHGMPVARVLTLLSANPAAILKLQDRGVLAEGKAADLILFDPATEWRFVAAESWSRSKNTPFDRAPMLGAIHKTLVAGRVIYSC